MRTLQSLEGQQEKTEYEYAGHLLERDGTCYLTYAEETDEAETSHTMLTYCGDSLALKRRGTFCQQMEFVPGKRTRAVYEVSAGRLPMEVQTHGLVLEADERAHRIRLEYQLFSSGALLGDYRMELDVILQGR